MKNTSLALVTLFATLSVAVSSSSAYAGHTAAPSFVNCGCGGGDGGSASGAEAGEKLGVDDDRAKEGDIREQ